MCIKPNEIQQEHAHRLSVNGLSNRFVMVTTGVALKGRKKPLAGKFKAAPAAVSPWVNFYIDGDDSIRSIHADRFVDRWIEFRKIVHEPMTIDDAWLAIRDVFGRVKKRLKCDRCGQYYVVMEDEQCPFCN